MADEDDEDDDVTDEESIRRDLDWLRNVATIEKDQRQREDEDLAFQEADGAWPDDIRTARSATKFADPKMPELAARPMVSVASLDEPIALIDSEERKAHLGVTIHPLTEMSTDDTAQILTAIYRGIERDSNAQRQRSWATQRATRAGRGVYRVETVYDPEGGHPLDQKILIKRVLYQNSVFFDPFAQEENWSDGRKAIEVVDIPWSIYKRKYKKSKLADATPAELTTLSVDTPDWVRQTGDSDETRTVRVAKVWRVEVTETPRVLLDDNSVADEHDIPAGRRKHPTDTRAVPPREERKVFVRTINCQEVLEPEVEHNGQYIPLIPAIGRELQPVKGKRKWIGLVANAKGAVRLTNYAASGAIEMAALEPKAPWQLDPIQIEGYEDWWKQSNTRNWPFLPSHHQRDGMTFERPTRTQVDVGRMGPSMQLLSMGRDFVRTATGLHAPALGENTPAHRSGRAIANLQAQSIEGTSIYLDNEAQVSLPYEALVILDLIPRIYDRPGRLARICDENYENSSLVMLNAPHLPGSQTQRPQPLPYNTPADQQRTDAAVADPNHPAKHYDLAKGRYGVNVQIGKSQPSRLAEGNDALSQLMQADPQLVPVLGPEWAKFQTFPGSKQVQEVLTKWRDHLMPFLAADQSQVDPHKLQAENEHLKQQLAGAAKMIETKQIEQAGKFKTAEMQEQYESDRAAADREVKLAVAELSAKVDRLSLFLEERTRLGLQIGEEYEADRQRSHEAAQADFDRAHEAATGAMDQQHEQRMTPPEPPVAPTARPGSPNGDGEMGESPFGGGMPPPETGAG